jgi:hypothetical protein
MELMVHSKGISFIVFSFHEDAIHFEWWMEDFKILIAMNFDISSALCNAVSMVQRHSVLSLPTGKELLPISVYFFHPGCIAQHERIVVCDFWTKASCVSKNDRFSRN